jgi:hypothetical protein
MSRISKRLPLAALVVAMLALFVALGPTAIGSSGQKAVPGGGAQVARTGVHLTVVGPLTTMPAFQQRIGVRATCPRFYFVTGGGALINSSNVFTSINSTIPEGGNRWRSDLNNPTNTATSGRTYARCVRYFLQNGT